MEVVVASLILALAVGGVLFVFSTEKISVAHTGRLIQAMYFPCQTLEHFRNEVGADTWPGGTLAEGGPTDDPLPNCDFKNSFGATRSYVIVDKDADAAVDSDQDGDFTNDVDYKEITVTITWSDPSG